MVTCPWCGTSYAAFQSNCDRCGGPLPPPPAAGSPAASRAAGEVPAPPPPPRPVSDNYAWRLVMSDGWGVTGLVFTLLGAIFTLIGGVMTIALVTAFVGLPFLVLGLAFLIGGAAVLRSRLILGRQTVAVLRTGQPVTGQITGVEENYNVRINNRHPWRIRYSFRVQEHDYQGSVNSLNPPGPDLQPGQAACVLYLPAAPQHSSLYPHP